MSKYKKSMLVDGIIIALGVVGSAFLIFELILALQGNIEFDFNSILPLPLALFFIFYGARQMSKDKKKYKDGEE